MKTPRINVTIDRLVLNGFPPDQRDTITAALIAGLQRQYSNPNGLRDLGGSRSLATVKIAPLMASANSKPQQIGTQAGQHLARSLRP